MEIMSIERGFERLLFDMCDKKMDVVLYIERRTLTGKMVKVDNGMIIFEEVTDRYRKNLTYVPIQRVLSVSSDFT